MEVLFNTSLKQILVKDMSNILDFNAIELEFLKLDYTNNINNLISKEMNFFDKELFKDTRKSILENCKQYLNHAHNLSGSYEDLVMTNSWGNVTEPGQNHHEHMHPFSVVSGVIYLDNNPSNLNLYIEAYMPDIPYFLSRNKTYISLKNLVNDTNTKAEDHKNLKYHMVLFLSNSSHFVEPIPNDSTPRRSIAFNTFWKGLVGTRENTLGSHVF